MSRSVHRRAPSTMSAGMDRDGFALGLESPATRPRGFERYSAKYNAGLPLSVTFCKRRRLLIHTDVRYLDVLIPVALNFVLALLLVEFNPGGTDDLPGSLALCV